jgi:hypothetical protein
MKKMFDWFRNLFATREYPTWKDVPPATDMEKISADMNKVLGQLPNPKTVPPMPDVKPIPPIPNIPTNQIKDHYRIGYDSVNGATTLTLIADYTSMTLSLGPEEVMRLIRMLGATLDDEDIIGNMHDGDLDEDDE